MAHVENDPEHARCVWAKTPTTGTQFQGKPFVRLAVHQETIKSLCDGILNAKLGEYCGLIHGNVWGEAENQEGTSGLINPVAIFKGLKRPMISPGIDQSVYVYVTNPDVNYYWPEERKFSGEGPILAPVPVDSVFVTFVSFRKSDLDDVSESIAGTELRETDGVVMFWEWTKASPNVPQFPYDYDNRYVEQVL